jgi:hypothetical protein
VKSIFLGLICLVILTALAPELQAGGNRGSVRASGKLTPGIIRQWPSSLYVGYPAYPAPALVVSPYFYPSYVVPTVVVVNLPYFCVLHNEGFVSRIGLLDHLSGTHKIPLESAANFCSSGSQTCVFPFH